MAKNQRLPHWLRWVMDEETDKIVSTWNVDRLDAFEISGTAWQGAGWRSFHSLKYPEFDICRPIEDWTEAQRQSLLGKANVVLAEQVWEHLKYPYRAGQNVLKMLRPGGRFLMTTPFLVRVHGLEYYSDCTRWTIEGMTYFLEECGFDPNTIKAFAWGNKECASAHILNEMWIDYQPGMNLENDPTYPCSVWAVARKAK